MNNTSKKPVPVGLRLKPELHERLQQLASVHSIGSVAAFAGLAIERGLTEVEKDYGTHRPKTK